MDFAPGDRVDRYVLVQPLGEGGQGSVWRAEDPLAPGQPRAIKLVPLVLARPNDVERVRREARALAKLDHASLVRCHALFEDLKHSALGVVMDFVDGTSLRAAADEPWMTDQHRFAALRHIAHALAYLHREGVVHRDLKLDNVLVRRAFWDAPEKAENIKLVDFGIAKVSDGSHALTAVDTIVGTIAYLSPELLDPSFFKSNGATAAADVFAFGVLAWKLLVGGHPTGLPAGAGIVAYGAAYRMVAGSTQPWPANAPPGAWGQLLTECLRVRSSERITDGVALADRCEQAGDFATSRRPEPADEPADPLAPTAEIGAAGMERPESADRTARAQAATQRQAVIPRLQERDGITNDAVVKPLEVQAAPRADTQVSAPLAATAQASPSSALLIAIGAIVLALAGGAAAFALWKPTPDPPRPLVPTATQAPTRSAAPVATPAFAAPEAAAEDAPSEAVIESPTRPAGCGADRPVCECCPSGRDCGPGHCDEDLKLEDEWHLRFGGATIDGAPIQRVMPDAELCVRIARIGDVPKCVKPSAVVAAATSILNVNGVELQGNGLEIELRSPADGSGRTLRAKLKRNLSRLALCQGIEIDQFAAVSGSAGTAKLLLFLDEPVVPPEKCAPREPWRSQ